MSQKYMWRVKGSFKTGSFGIELVISQKFVQTCISFLTGKELDASLKLLSIIGFSTTTYGGLLAVLRWLKNRTITKVVMEENGNATIQTESDSINTTAEVVLLLKDMETRKAVDAVIRMPLQLEGISSFKASVPGCAPIYIESEEVDSFITPTLPDEPLMDSVRTTLLQLVSISFQDENKWRFTEGIAPFHATVTDAVFLNKINVQEISFTKGDALKVELRCIQWRNDKGGLKTDYVVEKVIEHISQAAQIKLPF